MSAVALYRVNLPNRTARAVPTIRHSLQIGVSEMVRLAKTDCKSGYKSV